MAKQMNFGVNNRRNILKMDAREGCLKLRNGSGEDITFQAAPMIMNLADLEVGWAQFRKGEGVVMRGSADDEPPGEDWQLVVRVVVEGREDVPEIGGPIGEAEICSSSVPQTIGDSLRQPIKLDLLDFAASYPGTQGLSLCFDLHASTFETWRQETSPATTGNFNLTSWGQSP